MNVDTLLENFEILAEAPEGIDRLRELILNFAIRGSLVHQIAQEKSIEIEDEVGNFEVPKTWKWVKISSVAEFVNGFSFKSEEYKTSGVGIVRMSDLKFGQISVRDMKRVPMEYLASLDQNFRVVPGDLVIGMSGSIGKPCFNLTDETFLLNQRVGKFIPSRVDKSYLAIVLQNLENSFLEMSAGSGIKNLSTKQIKDSLLPLPPRAEQERIVVKVYELMALCDQLDQQQKQRDNLRTATRNSAIDAISTATTPEELEAAWKQINNNWGVIADTPESVESLRSLILSLAVLGKIVAQDPHEPTIFDELKNVDPKEVGEMLSTERQLQTRLPSNWAYAGFRHIGRWVGGNGFPTDKQGGRGNEILFCKVSDMNLDSNSKYIFETVNSLDLRTAKEMRVTPHAAGTVVFPKIGGAIATNKRRLLVKPTVIDNNCMGVSPSSVINPEWLYVLFRSIDLTEYQSGTSIPSISQRVLDEIRFGVPPRAEQKRIVEKVAELMALCDQFESELKFRSKMAEKFARSVVSAA